MRNLLKIYLNEAGDSKILFDGYTPKHRPDRNRPRIAFKNLEKNVLYDGYFLTDEIPIPLIYEEGEEYETDNILIINGTLHKTLSKFIASGNFNAEITEGKIKDTIPRFIEDKIEAIELLSKSQKEINILKQTAQILSSLQNFEAGMNKPGNTERTIAEFLEGSIKFRHSHKNKNLLDNLTAENLNLLKQIELSAKLAKHNDSDVAVDILTIGFQPLFDTTYSTTEPSEIFAEFYLEVLHTEANKTILIRVSENSVVKYQTGIFCAVAGVRYSAKITTDAKNVLLASYAVEMALKEPPAAGSGNKGQLLKWNYKIFKQKILQEIRTDETPPHSPLGGSGPSG